MRLICTMKPTVIIKQLLCRHDYQRTGTKMIAKNKHYIIPMTAFRCTKCGKIIYK